MPTAVLVDPSQWSENVAVALARKEGIKLGPDRWDAIRFMRRYWEEHQIAADARSSSGHLMERLGRRPATTSYELFPYGYPGQACKDHSMKRARPWSTR